MHPQGRHLFIGGRDRGLAWLRRLVDRQQPPLVVYCLQEDDHETEKHCPAIVQLCNDHGIPCKPRKRLGKDDEAEIATFRPDLIVVMGWRTIISDRVLSVPRLGSVGLHESLLPAYRGFAPVNWAVINGEKESGVSLFYLTSTGVDNGDIVDQAVAPIGPMDTAYEIYQQTARASIDLLEKYFDPLLAGTAPRKAQDEIAATYTCARIPDDGLIDWKKDTQSVHNLVRGLAHPYPGAFTYYGGKRYRIWSGEPVEPARVYIGRIPGRIIGFQPGMGVEVLTADGIYRVKTASEDGQPAVAAETLFKSVKASFRDQGAP